uniref:Uncharacterized protein n=1 Tax=Arundo donax TaxID=35708 RepID=A0A0A8ZN75_ARUDO
MTLHVIPSCFFRQTRACTVVYKSRVDKQ